MSETNGLDECLGITPSEASKHFILKLVKSHKLDDIIGKKEEYTINEGD